MLKCEIHDGDSYIETSGSLFEIMADVTYVLRRCYMAARAVNEEAGEAFKRTAQMLVADNDSPVWEEDSKQRDASDGIKGICIRLPKSFLGGSEER